MRFNKLLGEIVFRSPILCKWVHEHGKLTRPRPLKCDKILLALSEKDHNDVKEIKVDRNSFYVTQTCFGVLGQTDWWRNLSRLELKVGSDDDEDEDRDEKTITKNVPEKVYPSECITAFNALAISSHLRRMELSGMDLLEMKDFSNPNYFQNLQNFKLFPNKTAKEDLDKIVSARKSNLSSLRILSKNDWNGLDLSDCQNLQSLEISFQSCQNPFSLFSLNFLSNLSNLTSLELTILYTHPDSSKETVTSFTLPHLQNLKIRIHDFNLVRKEILESLFNSCPNVKSLVVQSTLGGCSDSMVLDIINKCSFVEVLNLSMGSNTLDKSNDIALANLSKLKYLKLIDWTLSKSRAKNILFNADQLLTVWCKGSYLVKPSLTFLQMVELSRHHKIDIRMQLEMC
jgi:hypothetical protein